MILIDTFLDFDFVFEINLNLEIAFDYVELKERV